MQKSEVKGLQGIGVSVGVGNGVEVGSAVGLMIGGSVFVGRRVGISVWVGRDCAGMLQALAINKSEMM